MADDNREKLHDRLSALKANMGKAGASDQKDHVSEDAISASVKKRLKVISEKRNREEKQEEFEKEIESEDMKKRIRSKDTVLFQYYVDLATVSIVGLVFFFTCITAVLHGVSQNMIMMRALISVGITSAIVYVVRKIIMDLFHVKKENEANEHAKVAGERKKEFEEQRQTRREEEESAYDDENDA
ncbi:MAG: hypothetical protein ACUZ8H_08065 [Candidatus Anammoxibacter sp.]